MKREKFDEFRTVDSDWITSIPNNWSFLEIKRLFDTYNGSTPSSSIPEYWNGEIEWITPDDLGRNNQKHISRGNRKITPEGYKSCGTHLVPKNSILISSRAPIGHLAIAYQTMCTNQGCKSLVPKTNDFDSNYYYYLILSIKPVLQILGKGTTFQELSSGVLGKIKVTVPPPPEQLSIAAFLDRETTRIDALIEKKQTLIELLKEKRTALITRAVTKGLDANAKMKDSGIEWLGEIPEHWEVKKLKYLVKQKLQYGANEAAELDDRELPRYIRITDIDDDGKLFENTFRSLDHSVAQPYLLDDGDMLFARSGATVGKTFLYEKNVGIAAFAGYLICARLCQDAIIPKLLYFFTKSTIYYQWIQSLTIQATIQNVSAEKYNNLAIAIPILDEQKKIVNYLNEKTNIIEKLSKLNLAAIEKLQEYRTALISAAVTGKVRVSGENN